MKRTLLRALVPLLLMGWIYFLSAQSDLNSGLGIIDLIGRKFIHALTYFSLTLAWWWALAPALTGRRSLTIRIAIAVAIAFLYACSDEYHQHFVTGRHGSPIDVAIDSVGIVAAVILVRRGTWGRLTRRERKAAPQPPPSP